MTNFAKLAEQAWRKLSGGAPADDSKWDIRELTLYARQSLAAIIKAGWFQNLQLEDKQPESQIVFSYPDLAITSTGFGEYYTDLPSSYISLPFKSGIVQVRPTNDASVEIIPVPSHFSSLYNGVYSQNLNNQIGYYSEGSRIYYTSNISLPTRTYTNVTVKLAGSFESVGDYDEINIPMDLQAAVVDSIFEKFSPEIGIQQDKIPDNNPQT